MISGPDPSGGVHGADDSTSNGVVQGPLEQLPAVPEVSTRARTHAHACMHNERSVHALMPVCTALVLRAVHAVHA